MMRSVASGRLSVEQASRRLLRRIAAMSSSLGKGAKGVKMQKENGRRAGINHGAEAIAGVGVG